MKEIDFLPKWYRNGKRWRIGHCAKYASLLVIFAAVMVWNFIASHSLSQAAAELVRAELKSVSNLYVIAASIVASGLFKESFPASVWMVCCFVMAGGMFWLGWHWLRLAGGVRSTAQQLGGKQSGRIEPTSNRMINELGEAINKHFAGDRSYIEELERQIEDLQLKIHLLRTQKRNTDAIIYSIRDAVIVIDEFDRLLMANEAAGKLFNFDYKNSQHKPVSELVCGEKMEAGTSEFVNFLRQNRQGKVQHTKRTIDFSNENGTKTFDCIVSCVYGEGERVCGMVAVLHDVTREKEISRMKSDFVNHVSHELRTPLASISAYSEMLADGEAGDEHTRKEFYSLIQNQAKRLNRLIEDTLNTSQMESGLIKVKKVPVSLAILIEEQMPMIKSYADEKNIEVIGQRPIVFDQVYADRDMISQVIINMLDNAVKYTPCGGSIRIETEIDEVAGMVRFSVTDTGVGIPEDEIEYIFDKFYRVGINKNQAKGTGLGLSFVKQIVEKVHNGRVFVASKVGAGSTFGFELPLATAEAVEA